MYGFNAGVCCDYERLLRMLQRGVQAYASPFIGFVDIIPTEQENSDENEDTSAEVSSINSGYSQETTDFDDVSINNEDKNVYPSLIGGMKHDSDCLGEAKECLTEKCIKGDIVPSEDSYVPTEMEHFTEGHTEQTADTYEYNADCTQKGSNRNPLPELKVAQENALDARFVESQARTLFSERVAPENINRAEMRSMKQDRFKATEDTPPDITGMTLKGQLQAIVKWTGGVLTPEETLIEAFGKQAVFKLISEGYLIRTKKGIIKGS